MTRVSFAALLAFLLTACADAVTTALPPSPDTQSRSMGTLTALVDDSSWNSGHVTVQHGGGLLRVIAIGWGMTDDRTYLDLLLETTVGLPQVIGIGKRPSASLVMEFYAGWLASGSMGHGTFTLTSLTEDRAVGTFSFTAELSFNHALPASVTPPVRVVRDGRFDIQLR